MAQAGGLTDRASDAAARALIASGRALPYRLRVPAVGRAMSALAPAIGWTRRIDENLDHVRPDISAEDRRALKRLVPDNIGRSLIETYSGEDFLSRVRGLVPEGPGAEALEAARQEGRAIVGVTAHFGNFNAARAAIAARGFRLGSLYRPMHNAAFDAHYVSAMEAVGGELFRQGRRGLAQMVRHLREGGFVGILQDLWVGDGLALPFLGQPAPTSLSAAELALRHGAFLVPIYGVRLPDGLSFRVHVGTPVEHSTAEEMTRALNADLEGMIEMHPEQWFWIHKRWKPWREERRLITYGSHLGAEGD